jgi:hypothetical protein
MKRTKKRDAQRPILVAIIGWIGVSAVLLGYGLNAFGLLPSDHPVYFLLNLLGAVALIIEAYLHHDIPPLLLNVIWGVIAAVGLVKYLVSVF